MGKQARALVAVFALVLLVLQLAACARNSEDPLETPDDASGQMSESSELANGERAESQDSGIAETDIKDKPGPKSDKSENAEENNRAVEYPTGWLAVDYEGLTAGTPVKIRHLPDIETAAHGETTVAHPEDGEKSADAETAMPDDKPILECDGRVFNVEPEFLLVNLPDVLPNEAYDVVYSYSSTSNCGGQSLPGVTGEKLDGYADGRQYDAYLDKKEYAVPCAYETAVKLKSVTSALNKSGYKLLVYDAYRPMRAQRQLSESFLEAYESDEAVRESLGDWSINWYVASGSSGHNFGTDIDVGLCDLEGNVLDMPSEFDAFDERGHLVDIPMNAREIQPDVYRSAVRDNEACMALHDTFVDAGFEELASEWWHFADKETENKMRSAIGDGGLDFTAYIQRAE